MAARLEAQNSIADQSEFGFLVIQSQLKGSSGLQRDISHARSTLLPSVESDATEMRASRVNFSTHRDFFRPATNLSAPHYPGNN